MVNVPTHININGMPDKSAGQYLPEELVVRISLYNKEKQQIRKM